MAEPRTLQQLLAEAIRDWIEAEANIITDEVDLKQATAEANTLMNYAHVLGLDTTEIKDAFTELVNSLNSDDPSEWVGQP